MQDLVNDCRTDIRAAIQDALEEMATAVHVFKNAVKQSNEKFSDALTEATLKFDVAANLRLTAFRGELSKNEETPVASESPPEELPPVVPPLPLPAPPFPAFRFKMAEEVKHEDSDISASSAAQ